MKVELHDIIKELNEKYNTLELEYARECQRDVMSRTATHLDGQLFMLKEVIDLIEEINEDACVDEIVESMFEDEDFEEPIEDDVSEIGYNPYTGGYDLDC